MPPTITYSVVPCGGAILLNITVDPSLDPNVAEITLFRSINGGPQNIVYQGIDTPVFIDAGENLPSYLEFTSNYNYTVMDSTGSATTGPITPSSQLVVIENYIDNLLFRLFSAGINALTIPQGYRRIQVLQQMPLTWGSELLPFITMNMDLEQQAETQIGEAVDASFNNIWTIPVIASRRYSIFVLSDQARERNYYKDAIKSVFYAIQSSLLQIGSGVVFSYQVAQSQVSEAERQPGFYEAQFMLDFEGSFNVQIQTDYPIIEAIDPDPNYVPSQIQATSTPRGGIKIIISP